jgi:hypothetical protein
VRAECLTDRLGAGEAENDEQKPPLRGQSGVSNWHCSTPLAPHLGHGDGALAPAPPQVVILMISVIIAPVAGNNLIQTENTGFLGDFPESSPA